MIGKTKFGFFIVAAVIILVLILFAQNGKQTDYKGTFVMGGCVGDIYKTGKTNLDG